MYPVYNPGLFGYDAQKHSILNANYHYTLSLIVLFDLLGATLEFLTFIFKICKMTSKLFIKGYKYHKLRKSFWKFFRSYSELFSNFGTISFQEFVSTGI